MIFENFTRPQFVKDVFSRKCAQPYFFTPKILNWIIETVFISAVVAGKLGSSRRADNKSFQGNKLKKGANYIFQRRLGSRICTQITLGATIKLNSPLSV